MVNLEKQLKKETTACACTSWHVDASREQNSLSKINRKTRHLCIPQEHPKGQGLVGIVSQQAAAVSGNWQAQSV